MSPHQQFQQFHHQKVCFISDLVKGKRAFRGLWKNKIGKAELVGPRSCECHVLRFSVYFNSILDSGGNGRAIGLV